MRTGEVGFIIGELEAAVPPGRRADDMQRDMFTSGLLALDYRIAQEAVRRMRDRIEWFPAWSEFLTAYDSEAARQRAMQTPHESSDDCPECFGDKVVFLKVEPTILVRPCSRCDPIPYQRWAEGHFMSGHSCQECVDLRAGGGAGKDARNAVKARYAAVPLDDIRRARQPISDGPARLDFSQIRNPSEPTPTDDGS